MPDAQPNIPYKDRDPAEMSLGDHLEELRRRLIFALIGIVPLATGLLGNCPLYSVFSVSTCARRES